jgi:hypothetical protein
MEMKKNVLLIALTNTILCGNLLALNKSETKKWEGFRNLRWGMRIDDINDPFMVIDHTPKTEKNVLCYMKKDENLSYEHVQLDGIRYYFYEGRLYQIKIRAKEKNSNKMLKQVIFDNFGEGKKEIDTDEIYTWGRSMTNGKVGFILNCTKENLGMFTMIYLPIFKEKEDAQKKSKDDVEQNKSSDDNPEIKKWEGFRNLRWGTRAEDVNDPNLINDGYSTEEKDVYYYRKKNEKPTIGNAQLSDILYYFYKDKFYKVEITTFLKHDYETLKQAIFARFGDGKKTEDVFGEEIYTWSPDMTNGNVIMLLTFEEHEWIDCGKFTMVYVPVLKEIEEDKKKAAEDAARDF